MDWDRRRMFGLITHVHTEKLHVRFAGWRKRGACWTHNSWSPPSTCIFLILHSSLLLSLSVRATVVCASCIWADTGNQVLCVSINYTPREITHLELKQYHKLLRISACYRWLQQPRLKFPNSALGDRIFIVNIKGKALESIYALLGWVSQDTN